MNIQFDDYPPYFDSLSENFETNINKNLRCCHEYKNYDKDRKWITWVSKNTSEMFHLDLSEEQVIIPCIMKIIYISLIGLRDPEAYS